MKRWWIAAPLALSLNLGCLVAMALAGNYGYCTIGFIDV